MQNFGGENPKERDHSEDQDVDKREILRVLLNK